VAERQAELVKADVERLVLLDDILGVVLDTDVDDAAFGLTVRSLGPERLARAARGDDDRLPRDNGRLELMEASFAHVRGPADPANPAGGPWPVSSPPPGSGRSAQSLLQCRGGDVGLLPKLEEYLLPHLRVSHCLLVVPHLRVRPQLGQCLPSGVRVGDGLPVELHLRMCRQLVNLPPDAAVLLLTAAATLSYLGPGLLTGLWVGHGLPGRLDLRVLGELFGLGAELVVALPAGPGPPQISGGAAGAGGQPP